MLLEVAAVAETAASAADADVAVTPTIDEDACGAASVAVAPTSVCPASPADFVGRAAEAVATVVTPRPLKPLCPGATDAPSTAAVLLAAPPLRADTAIVPSSLEAAAAAARTVAPPVEVR